MTNSIVASRYAKSLLDLALEQGSLEKVHADMLLIEETCKHSKELAIFLKSPVIKPDKKRAVLKQVFSGKLSPITDSFIDLMTVKLRESYLEPIAAEFIKQYKRHKNILTAVITTASGLDDNLRKQVLDLVKKSENSEIELVEKVDKGLIGGFVLRIGDRQVDASILRQLHDLRKEFSENPYIKEF
jgi:F-type H+-transporting ATPase subunit delta